MATGFQKIGYRPALYDLFVVTVHAVILEFPGRLSCGSLYALVKSMIMTMVWIFLALYLMHHVLKRDLMLKIISRSGPAGIGSMLDVSDHWRFGDRPHAARRGDICLAQIVCM